MAKLRARLGGETGFSLAKLLVVIAVLGMVLGGVLTIFASSQQTYLRALSQEEAQMSGRVGVERIARELRYAGAFYSNVTGAGPVITAATPTSITFLGDIDGDSVFGPNETQTTGAIAKGATTLAVTGTALQISGAFNAYPLGALNDWVYIGGSGLKEVKQLVGVAGTNLVLTAALTLEYPQFSIVRSIEQVTLAFDAVNGTLTRTEGGQAPEVIASGVTNLTFAYFDGAGDPTVVPGSIREIQINLTTQGDDGLPRTMMTRVTPGNLE